MNRLIIECCFIFLITFLLLQLLRKYINFDILATLILLFILCYMCYKYYKIENYENNTNETTNNDSSNESTNNESTNNDSSNESTNNETTNNDSSNESTNNDSTNNDSTNNDLTNNDSTNNDSTNNESTNNETTTNEPETTFTVNNNNQDGTLKFFSDKNIKQPINNNTYVINQNNNNIAKQNTRNQFQAINNQDNNQDNNVENISIEGVKADDIITDENKIELCNGNVYIDANNLYVPKNYKYTKDDYGYNFIPPLYWLDIPRYGPVRIPICVSANGNCKVQATHTSGYPVYLKEWNESRKVTGPAQIDTTYIQEHLNTINSPDKINT